MIKSAYFASRDIKGWPRPDDIEHYFLDPPGQRWFFETTNDTAGFDADGVDGTEHLPELERSRISLALSAHPSLGVMAQWSKWDGKRKNTFYAKGNLSRRTEFVRNMHGTPLSVGLLVPYELAWKAVKEFLETDGQLPKSIEWIASRDLPPDTFPDP
jgi:immunity protein Imm1 of predicted polymorphic toxin system